jgi:hypothetical protein
MKLKTYEFRLRHDKGEILLRTKSENLAAAKEIILTAENAPERAILSWRVVPTPKQIQRTKNLMRNL